MIGLQAASFYLAAHIVDRPGHIDFVPRAFAFIGRSSSICAGRISVDRRELIDLLRTHLHLPPRAFAVISPNASICTECICIDRREHIHGGAEVNHELSELMRGRKRRIA